MNFDTFLANELNEQQYQAVTQPNGALLVIAGAGSGKTRIITARIAHLILKQQSNPASIVALTFTNKAAQEMRSRVIQFIGTEVPGLFVGTFHAYCLRILRENTHLTHYQHFSILDETDQEALIKKIITALGSQHILPKQALHTISFIKNSGTNPIDHAMAQSVTKIYQHYEAEKKASNCLDFDDLLLNVIDLFTNNHEFTQSFHTRIRHILVDEYQDTNTVQHLLLKHMSIKNKKCILDSLCIVGDEDQAIYSWRGATVDNIVNFDQDVTNTTIITIEQNYRSVKPVLDAANHLISNNSQRHPKKLWSNRSGANCIAHCICASEYQEAEFIAYCARIQQQYHANNPLAVLYRTHAQSRAIEEALLRRNIPYIIIGGIRFYERKEIKDLIAYIRLIVNPFDRIAFNRAINCPPRTLGQVFSELFETQWQQQPFMPFYDIARQLIISKKLKPQQLNKLKEFLSIFDTLSPESSITHALTLLNERTAYIHYLRTHYDAEESHERIQNVKELVQAAEYACISGPISVEQFLHNIMIMQEQHTFTNQEQHPPVQLMTLHAAKGLEFDLVIIAGLEDGLLPSARSLDNQSNLEEERRLLYVGITRAQNRLLLLQAENRYIFGSLVYQTPSRFLDELPTAIIRERCTHWNEQQVKSFLHSFIGNHQQHATPSCTSSEKAAQPLIWKKYQPVKHATFGVGVIQEIEHRAHDTTYLTIQFKNGTKRITSSFVTQLTSG